MTVARLMPLMFVLCSACSMFTDPDRVRTLGEIAGYNEGDPQITVEQDGRTLTVLVTTYGGGCYSRGETDVVVEGLTATISPWDYTARLTDRTFGALPVRVCDRRHMDRCGCGLPVMGKASRHRKVLSRTEPFPTASPPSPWPPIRPRPACAPRRTRRCR